MFKKWMNFTSLRLLILSLLCFGRGESQVLKKNKSVQFSIQRRLLGSSSIQTTNQSSIFGSLHEEGCYSVQVKIGTPPQEFSAIIDTGSTDLIIPCQSCIECGKNHRVFFPEKSKTLREQRKTFTVRYMEGSSIRGEVFEDVVSISGKTCRRAFFGCASQMSNRFQKQHMDGILGLNRAKNSFLNHIRLEHGVLYDAMTLHLNKKNGYILIGDWRSSLTSTQIESVNWAKMEPSTSDYIVKSVGISIEGDLAPYETKVLIDSGTTYNYYEPKLFELSRKQMRRYCNDKKRFCNRFKMRYGSRAPDRDSLGCFLVQHGEEEARFDISSFPTLTFALQHEEGLSADFKKKGGIHLSMTPDTYFYGPIELRDSRAYCIGIFNTYGIGPTTLGQVNMIDETLFFDNENSTFGVL